MGFFLTLLITAALFAVSEFLRPKIPIEDARPASRGDFKFPTASQDRVNPIIWGTVLLEGPNVVWWTLARQEAIIETIKTGMFSKQEFIKGWRYYISMQMALCRGSTDFVITRVLIGDKEVFAGVQGEGTFDISEPDLFGGEDLGSGGVVGPVDVLVGTTTQAPNSYLEGFQTNTVAATPNAPRYGGSAYMVAREVYHGTSTQVAAWKIEGRRIPNGLGLPGGEAILNGGNDANLANVAYEVITNSEWGLGYAAAAIDTSNFAAAGAVLAAEGNGFSFLLDNARKAPDMLEELERQMDGVIRVNRTTGRWEIKLARADYDIDTVPQITDLEVKSVEDFTRGHWLETTNEVRVIFSHRASDYVSVPAFAHDQANIEIQNRGVPVRIEYPGVKDPDLAAQIASRELRTLSYPLASARIRVDRSFYAVNRADVVAWTNTQHGITKMAMRITTIDYGTIQEGTIELGLVEDVFRFEVPSFSAPPATKWTRPQDALQPFAAGEQMAIEAPRKFLTLEGGGVADRIWVGARQQDVAALFRIMERHAGGSPSGDFLDAGAVAGFLYLGKLLGTLDAGSTIPLTTLILDPDPDTQLVLRTAFSPATPGDIGNFLSNLILVDDEFIGVESAEDVGGNVQLNDAYRALCDSVQADHASGAVVWLVFVAGNLTDTSFPAGNNVDIKLLPRSRSDEVAEGDATTIALALNNRLRRPYPPSRILLNAAAYPATVSMEGAGSDADDYGVEIDFTRRDFRTVDEVEALTTDAETTFPDFPAVNDTKYVITVREDPSGSNLLVATFTDVQPPQTVLRNDILKVTDGDLSTVLQFTLQAKHTVDGIVYEALQNLVYEPAATTALTGDFNFGALDGYEISNVYTATVAGQYDFTLVSALPGGTATVEYRLNGGVWDELIAAAATTGNIPAVAVSDTIEIRHLDVTADVSRFLAMSAAGAGQDGYAMLFTGAFAPDSLPELTAWWNFSDVADLNLSGTTILGAYDKSGNDRHLTQSGSARPKLTTVGSMYMGWFQESFPHWMAVGDNPVHNFGSGDFTILIIYRTADDDRACLLDKGVTLKYTVRINNTDVSPTGKFGFDINDGSTYTVLDSAIDYADDVVRLVTMRRDGDNLRTYADGVETAASPTDITGVGSIDDPTSLYVGVRQASQQPLDGEIGEIIMYKGTITPTELALVHDWLIAKWGL